MKSDRNIVDELRHAREIAARWFYRWHAQAIRLCPSGVGPDFEDHKVDHVTLATWRDESWEEFRGRVVAVLAKSPAKSFFAIMNSSERHQTAKYFSTVEAARKHLQKMADERRNRLGVTDFKQTENGFSFILGWEEHQVSFYIVELPIEE